MRGITCDVSLQKTIDFDEFPDYDTDPVILNGIFTTGGAELRHCCEMRLHFRGNFARFFASRGSQVLCPLKYPATQLPLRLPNPSLQISI